MRKAADGSEPSRKFAGRSDSVSSPCRAAGTAHTPARHARAAADHGYAILLAPDSMFLLSPYRPSRRGIGGDIGVGTLVMSSPLRPRRRGMEAHSLALLTEGRFELGIGAGLSQCAVLGVRWPRGRDARQRIRSLGGDHRTA